MAYFDAPYRPADLTVDSSHSLVTNMQAWFPLTAGSGSVAQCILHPSHTGTLSSGVTWETSERGTVAVFDGTSNARISLSSALVSGQTLSFSVWLYINSSTATRVQIYSSAYAGHVKNQFRFSPLFNNFTFDQYPPGGGGIDTPADTGVEGRWVHAVVTQDSSDTKIYYDGELKVTGTAETYSGSAPTVFDIGSDNGANSFDGKMQNFQAWDRVISADEVALLHARPWTASNYDTEALWLSPPASPTLSTASESTSIMANCVVWWPLVEGSGSTATDLVGSNNGTITNGAWAAETVGTAADLGTTSNISGTGVNVSTAATFSLWYKDSGGTASGPMLFSLPRSTGGADGVNIQHRGTGVRFTVYSTATGALSSATATFSINDGDWHHIAGTYDGANIRLYADGAQLATNTQSGAIGHLANGEFNINGLSSGTSGFSCDGIYQNVRVFDAALTADQISLLYERPFIGAEYNETAPLYPPVPSSLTPLDSSNSILTSLEAWWPLTETDNFASGAADIGGSANTGTKSGGVTSEFSQVGTAANFDNTGHIDVGKSFWDSGVVSANAFTFNAWFKVDNSTADHGIFGSWNSASEALIVWVDVGGSNVSLTAICGDGTTQAITSVDKPIVSVGQWHMGSVVFDGSANTLKVYLDGVYSNQNSSATATLTSAPMGFHIGDDGSTSRTTEGLIHNCRIWSRALSSTEIANIYYSPWLGSAYPSTGGGTPSYFVAAQFNRLGIGPRFRRL